ncbi:MAG: glycoside hydrolase family 25 protein [Terriglobales bacterium]
MSGSPIAPPVSPLQLTPTAPLEGIDVSHHQGRLNWSGVSGIDFVYMKASEGVRFADPCFAANWAGTGGQRLLRGAYHFFRPQQEAEAQAWHFLQVVGKLQPGDLPPALDLEPTSLAGEWVELLPAERVARVLQWLEAVKQGSGRRPLIYVSPAFWRDVLGGSAALSAFPLWIAEYEVMQPRVPPAWPTWTFWQYSQAGRVAGVAANVDRNRFQGTRTELETLATS